jgi:hypothetical protein
MSTLPADPGGGGGEDIVVTDRQLFDSAISDPAPQPQPEPQPSPSAPSPDQVRGPEPAAQPQQPPQPAAQPGEQPRDAQGRWANKQAQQPRPQQQPPQPQPQGGGAQQPQAPHHVPLRELLDERERRYRIQAEHDQMRRAWDQLQRQQQQAALAAQQAQMPQTIYDNPDQYLFHNVIQPLRNEGHMAMLQIKDGLSREWANTQFGEQNVTSALSALASFRHTPDGTHLYNQIMSSGHPYGALVRWFNNARAQQAIGPDPNAWVQKQRQAWLDDEAMQAEAAKRWYARQQQRQPQQQQRVQGGRPNVQLPPSLSSLPSSSGRADQGGDLSDAHLWRFATSR